MIGHLMMKDEDRFLKGLFALGGTLLSAYVYSEARKAFEQNWREDNRLGVFVSAGAMSAAQAGCALSLKELFRALGLQSEQGPVNKRPRNPLFLPNYEKYPA